MGAFSSAADTLRAASMLRLMRANGALAGSSFEERKAMPVQMGKLVIDEQFVVPVARTGGLLGGSKRIGTFPRSAGVTGPHKFEHVVPSD